MPKASCIRLHELWTSPARPRAPLPACRSSRSCAISAQRPIVYSGITDTWQWTPPRHPREVLSNSLLPSLSFFLLFLFLPFHSIIFHKCLGVYTRSKPTDIPTSSITVIGDTYHSPRIISIPVKVNNFVPEQQWRVLQFQTSEDEPESINHQE